MSDRNEMRTNLLGTHLAKTKNINIFGEVVEVRQPRVEAIARAREDEDSATTLARLLIDNCFVPDTDEKVFEIGDVGSILEWPVDTWLTEFNEAIESMTNINVVNAEKNSEADRNSTT